MLKDEGLGLSDESEMLIQVRIPELQVLEGKGMEDFLMHIGTDQTESVIPKIDQVGPAGVAYQSY